MSQRWSITVAAMLVAAPALHAQNAPAQNAADARWLAECRDEKPYYQDKHRWLVEHCEVRVSQLVPGGTITVDPGENGAVAVEGWDRGSIEVHARIQTHALTEDEAIALARGVEVVTSGVSIGARGPTSKDRAYWSASFVVYAPRASDLRADTYNGPIAVRELRGHMQLTAYNGPIDLDGVGGDVRARTTNGPLDVTLAGAHWDGAGLDAETTNGPVSLAIPEGYSARLEFGTVNGPMSLAFPLTVTIQGQVGRHIATTLGAGGPLVKVVTTNGPVEIRRN